MLRYGCHLHTFYGLKVNILTENTQNLTAAVTYYNQHELHENNILTNDTFKLQLSTFIKLYDLHINFVT
jgi:hypothetical protein